MVWNIAAGIIIGGLALGLTVFGAMLQLHAAGQGNERFESGWYIFWIGAGLSTWVLFFKAHILG